MVFASPVFLFLFLPLLLVLHAGTPHAWRNGLLLAASLFFYAWGEIRFLWVMLLSIVANYGFGLAMARRPDSRALFVVATGANLLLLAAFKYADFLVANVNRLGALAGLPVLPMPHVHLPIGISFFTFHSLSYLWDVRLGKVPAQRRLVDFALYIALFPQLIAGPIIRYHYLAPQLAARTLDVDGAAEGIRRFVVGLAKKMLIANVVAVPVDAIYALPPGEITAALAWFGAACYMLQIYFDFSGYSDMAIGLARLFGFVFPENFAYPYVATSITDFWRRWHITLSTWFRDYLYVPLGGNRTGAARTYRNLATVFFLCGLWHGASWTFVVWGLYHGAFLILERTPFGRLLQRTPRVVQHAYASLVVLVGWVFFRADSWPQAAAMLRAMVGLGAAESVQFHVALYADHLVLLAMAAGIVAATPLAPAARASLARLKERAPQHALVGEFVGFAAVAGLFLLAAARLAAGTYNPFIYFRF
ncbi:MAG: MBOAT family protein [bacterium]|nr:MBOAT family protein [bacterium]